MADVPLMENPMTTAEDLIVGGTSGAPARLGVGSEGDVLTVSSSAVAWAAAAGGGGSYTWIDDTLQPDEYPGSPATVDDEFEGGGAIDAKWTALNDPGSTHTPNQTDVAGVLHLFLEELGTDNVANYTGLTQTAPTGTATAEYEAKVALVAEGNAGDDGEFAMVAIGLLDSANGQSIGAAITINNSDTGDAFTTIPDKATAGTPGSMAAASGRMHWLPGAWVWLKLKKTSASAYTSSNTYEAWISGNGIAWQQFGADTQTFTGTPVVGISAGAPSRRPARHWCMHTWTTSARPPEPRHRQQQRNRIATRPSAFWPGVFRYWYESQGFRVLTGG